MWNRAVMEAEFAEVLRGWKRSWIPWRWKKSCGISAEMKMHFTAMLLLLCLHQQKESIMQQFLSNPFPWQRKVEHPLRYWEIIREPYSLNVDWHMYQRSWNGNEKNYFREWMGLSEPLRDGWYNLCPHATLVFLQPDISVIITSFI